MAQIQTTQWDKTTRHLKKKIRLTFQSLKPSKIQGRFNGPVVLSNSIPKSGTHLIENVLELIPFLRNSGTKTLSIHHDELTKTVVNKLCSMKKGAFYNAHLPAHKDILDVIVKFNVKVVFLIRDPRDILVSRYKYITYIDKLHPAHKALVEANNDHERLLLSIKGIPGIMPSIQHVLSGFRPWLDKDISKVFRFEELIGDAGGGSDHDQESGLKNLLNYLGHPLKHSELKNFQKIAFARKSSTFRKGQIGSWKSEFTDMHNELLHNEAGELLKVYGYH